MGKRNNFPLGESLCFRKTVFNHSVHTACTIILAYNLMCLSKRKRNASTATPNTRKQHRACGVINLVFLLFSELECYAECSLKHMSNYFSLCVFFNECVKLCMGSSYHVESEPMNVLETEGSLKFWN